MIKQDSASVTVPRQTLSILDAIAIIVGIVVGAGIFRTPSIVAASAGSKATFLLVWPLGGAISLIGALCYAELASAYPNEGGDYHYFALAFGKQLAFLFAWARLMVIQTGSIVILAFVFGDYSAQLFPLGRHASAVYAAGSIVLLTIMNSLSVKRSTSTQNLLSAAKLLGLICVFLVGLFVAGSQDAQAFPRTLLSVNADPVLRQLRLYVVVQSCLYRPGSSRRCDCSGGGCGCSVSARSSQQR